MPFRILKRSDFELHNSRLCLQVFLLEEQTRVEDASRSPDERSYVFLLYPPAVGTTLNPDLYIVRVQLRALVVGLLVHQMLLQCIASVLLQGAGIPISSLSHVIPHSTPCSSPNLNAKRGSLSYLNPHHVEIFLSALDLAYVAALKFDCRPGLKFVVQKVANLEQPANLYRQAAAAWTIKIITLLELCLREIEELHATLELVKSILGTGLSDRECVYDVKHRKLTKYLRQLRTTFDELCETYVEVVLDEDGKYTKVDSFAERKIFLLVAQPDDYPEITRKEPIDDRLVASTPAPIESLKEEDREIHQMNPDQSDQRYYEKEDDQDDPDDADVYNPNLDDESGLEELGDESENDPRPFRLSDLAAEYSTDSGPQSEPETDDSRPMSRLGSVTEKIVYPDRSGGTSSEGYIDVKYGAVTPAPPRVMYCGDDLCCNSDSLWKTKSTDTCMGTSMSVRTLDRNAFSAESFLYQNSYPERRVGSDACPLSRRKSLTFIKTDLENARQSWLADSVDLRPKSVMELRRKPAWTMSDDPTRESKECVKERDKKNSKSSQILDNIDELLRDYERSKRGFRTNPFLRNEEEKSAAENQPVADQEAEFQRGNVTKDSEAHRKAWADTLGAALEWALILPDERLAPLLPVFVGGVRILTRHAVDQSLKQRLSALFHRIAVLYGLTNN